MKTTCYLSGVFLMSLTMVGCTQHYDTRPYRGTPYCYDRTAGSVVEYYAKEMHEYVATVEPAAGQQGFAEKIFREAMQK